MCFECMHLLNSLSLVEHTAENIINNNHNRMGLFRFNKLFFPTNISDHWHLTVVKFCDYSMYTHDSHGGLLTEDNICECTQSIVDYIILSYNDLKDEQKLSVNVPPGQALDWRNIECLVPQQERCEYSSVYSMSSCRAKHG